MSNVAKDIHSQRQPGKTRFLAKSLGLAALTIFLQLAAVNAGWRSGDPLTGETPSEFNARRLTAAAWDRVAVSEPNILYLGDSTLYPMPSEPAEAPFTPDILAQLLPNCRVEALFDLALAQSFYARMLDQLANRSCRPQLVVVPVNVRMFSPMWYLNPDFQFNHFRRFLKHDSIWFRAFYRPLISFGAIKQDTISIDAYHQAIFTQYANSPIRAQYDARFPGGQVPISGVLPFSHYGAQLDEANPEFRALADVQAAANRLGARVLFYLAPTDLNYIERLLGADTAAFTRQKIKRVEQWLKEHGQEVVDCTDAVNGIHILPMGASADHMLLAGRKQLAHALAAHIQTNNLASCANDSVSALSPPSTYSSNR